MACPENADLWVRSVIHAAGEDLCEFLRVGRLDRDLIADLYIRLREDLADWDGVCEVELVDQFTMTVYLTAATWAPAGTRSPDLLASLRRTIAKTVHAGTENNHLLERHASRKEGVEQ